MAREFLATLQVRVGQDELQLWKDEPPDVIFNEARFEVKEILDEGRRRGAEYRDAAARAREALSTQDLLEGWDAEEVEVKTVFSEVESCANDLVVKYEPKLRRTLDLLVYFNREVMVRRLDDNNSRDLIAACPGLRSSGFRSVSVFGNSFASVLHAAGDGPHFLVSALGRVLGRAGSP